MGIHRSPTHQLATMAGATLPHPIRRRLAMQNPKGQARFIEIQVWPGC